jgi:hypothetical protein
MVKSQNHQGHIARGSTDRNLVATEESRKAGYVRLSAEMTSNKKTKPTMATPQKPHKF